MKQENPVAKNQHYVPRFILKRFAIQGKKPQVFVFEKRSGKIFKTHIKNIACENGFYDIEFKGVKLTLENSISSFEGISSQLIGKIISDNSLEGLTQENKLVLSHFFSLQFVRTREYRSRIYDAMQQLENHLKKGTDDLSSIEGYKPLSDKIINEFGIESVLKHDLHAPHFFQKDWVLYEAPAENYFITSDNPIALQNIENFGSFYGNLGLACKGIEIYFPLTPKLCLAILCPSHREKIEEIYQYYHLTQKYPSCNKFQLNMDFDHVESYMKAYRKGTVVEMCPENVINCNSLQVMFSDFQLYSATNDFTIAKQMIEQNESYKTGMRIQVG
jgi:hypothetical protein